MQNGCPGVRPTGRCRLFLMLCGCAHEISMYTCICGGGVFIIAKDEISITEIEVTNTDCSLVVAKIMLKDEADITVGAFYRQPNSTITEIDDLMTTLLSIQNRHRTTKFIIGGDFNLPAIMWGDSVNIKDTPSYGPQVNTRFVEISESLGLTQIVEEPTREGNILDLILVTSPDRCQRVDVEAKVSRNKKKPRNVYLFKHADMNSIKQDITTYHNEQFKLDLEADNTNSTWEKFKEVLL